LPQLGQKIPAGAVVFGLSWAAGWVVRRCFERFLPRTVASIAATNMITTKIRPPRNMGEDKRFELPFSGVAAGVSVDIAPGVAVGSIAV